MDAIIKISGSEFNEELFDKIRSLIRSFGNAEITIAVHDTTGKASADTKDEYWNRLSKSITDIENGNGLTFTMEELETYIRKEKP
jgi:hypothetical protein